MTCLLAPPSLLRTLPLHSSSDRWIIPVSHLVRQDMVRIPQRLLFWFWFLKVYFGRMVPLVSITVTSLGIRLHHFLVLTAISTTGASWSFHTRGSFSIHHGYITWHLVTLSCELHYLRSHCWLLFPITVTLRALLALTCSTETPFFILLYSFCLASIQIQGHMLDSALECPSMATLPVNLHPSILNKALKPITLSIVLI